MRGKTDGIDGQLRQVERNLADSLSGIAMYQAGLAIDHLGQSLQRLNDAGFIVGVNNRQQLRIRVFDQRPRRLQVNLPIRIGLEQYDFHAF